MSRGLTRGRDQRRAFQAERVVPAKALWRKEAWNILETEKKPKRLDRRQWKTDRKLGGGQGWAWGLWGRILIFISRANHYPLSVLTGNPAHRGEKPCLKGHSM